MSPIQRVPRRYLLGTFWCACIVIGVLALVPATTPLPSTGWDKSNHALAFAALAFTGGACWPANLVRMLVGLAAYGGAIEIAQTFTETRFGEWGDWFADLVGLLVVAVYLAWRRGRRAPY